MSLKKIRKAKGLLQQQLAELSGVSVNTIRSYEQGKRDINIAEIENISKLAIALNVPISELLTDEKLKKLLENAVL